LTDFLIERRELPENLPSVERILPCTLDQSFCKRCGKETVENRLRGEVTLPVTRFNWCLDDGNQESTGSLLVCRFAGYKLADQPGQEVKK